MNKQGNPANPRGGIEWTHILGPGTGYTANPVRGCAHRCEWEMPDGKVARCYAKEIRDRLDGVGAFETISWHPEVLETIRRHKSPAGIFLDSMSDLFGQGVERGWIDEVIHTIFDCPQHVFFSLTKNPSRFREFNPANLWPRNWLCGISYPPTFMFGKRLTVEQQTAWFSRGMKWLVESPAQAPWVSIEPLSLDLSGILRDYRRLLRFAVIGAASNGAATHQPTADVFAKTLDGLHGVPVFFKGNLSLKLATEVADGWREEFPVIEAPACVLV